MQDQQAALDFAYVAVGRVALLSRQIIGQYYGKPAERAYFTGCSTGGREGMLMAQRPNPYRLRGRLSRNAAVHSAHIRNTHNTRAREILRTHQISNAGIDLQSQRQMGGKKKRVRAKTQAR